MKETTSLEYKRFLGDPITPSDYWLQFHHSKGLCRGATYWFLSLYSKAEGLFATDRERLIAVARQFETGMPRQAALLHTLNLVENSLLNLNASDSVPDERVIHPIELNNNPSGTLDKIRNLPPGLYYTGLNCHAIAYIKCDENTGYIWDPIFGAIDLSGPKQAQLLLDRIMLQHDPKTIHKVYFQEVALKQNADAATGTH